MCRVNSAWKKHFGKHEAICESDLTTNAWKVRMLDGWNQALWFPLFKKNSAACITACQVPVQINSGALKVFWRGGGAARFPTGTEITFTLCSPLTVLAIAGDACAPARECISMGACGHWLMTQLVVMVVGGGGEGGRGLRDGRGGDLQLKGRPNSGGPAWHVCTVHHGWWWWYRRWSTLRHLISNHNPVSKSITVIRNPNLNPEPWKINPEA